MQSLDILDLFPISEPEFRQTWITHKAGPVRTTCCQAKITVSDKGSAWLTYDWFCWCDKCFSTINSWSQIEPLTKRQADKEWFLANLPS